MFHANEFPGMLWDCNASSRSCYLTDIFSSRKLCDCLLVCIFIEHLPVSQKYVVRRSATVIGVFALEISISVCKVFLLLKNHFIVTIFYCCTSSSRLEQLNDLVNMQEVLLPFVRWKRSVSLRPA